MKCEQHKTRKSSLPDEAIAEMAEQLSGRFFTFKEFTTLTEAYGYKGSLEVILSLFNVRGYMITEEMSKKHKTIYKIVNKEDYEKYDEEAHKDAKRRLLAAVSY